VKKEVKEKTSKSIYPPYHARRILLILKKSTSWPCGVHASLAVLSIDPLEAMPCFGS
jgi:hypothetical protein